MIAHYLIAPIFVTTYLIGWSAAKAFILTPRRRDDS